MPKKIRPFKSYKNEPLFELGHRAGLDGDLDTFTWVVDELGRRKSNLAISRYTILKSSSYPKAIPWLRDAKSATEKLYRKIEKMIMPGEHSVYVVLLLGTPKSKKRFGGYSMYVGETRYTPEERFNHHLAGGFTASSKVSKFGVCLLPSLYFKFNPLDSTQAKLEIESQLAQALKETGVTVYGGTMTYPSTLLET